MAGRWVALPEGAEVLGVSAEAVRKRASRGTLESRKGEDGRVYVRVDDGRTTGGQASRGEPVEELRDRVRFLERALETEQEGRRRADTIIAQLSQATTEQARTIRAIETPDTTSEATRTQDDQSGTPEGSSTRESGESVSRPWWRRLLGGR